MREVNVYMKPLSIAELESAVAEDTLEAGLDRIPDPNVRARLKRSLELDRRLWRQYPASLGSCLLARTFGDPDFALLHAQWQQELEARQSPWIRPLSQLPVTDGLIAELRGGPGLSLAGLHFLHFESEEVVSLIPPHYHPSNKPPEPLRGERVLWYWRRDEPVVEPYSHPERSSEQDQVYPRLESHGWGPVYLIRSPEEPPITLPCPKEGDAQAQFTANGQYLIVYGSLEAYEGGFVYVLDATTLKKVHELALSQPVSDVFGCSDPDLLVVNTSDSLVAWIGDRTHRLSTHARQASLSPSGAYLATFDGSIRIWSTSELMRVATKPSPVGFPVTFNPSGSRLLSGLRILDGRSGQLVATLELTMGGYLEGGPAWPWLHFGERYLISMYGALMVWDARTGEPEKVEHSLHFPHWYVLSYDRDGSLLAALRKGASTVELYGIPGGQPISSLKFDIRGRAIDMSPDGTLVAVKEGQRIEVRRTDGLLVKCFGSSSAQENSPEHRYWQAKHLRFSTDGRRIARFNEAEGWRIWSLMDDREEIVPELEALEQVADFASPRLYDWAIEGESMTLFTHLSTGTRIALPAAGPWTSSPADPRIQASEALHLELCAP